MDSENELLAALFPNLATQLRTALSNVHLAAAQLAPAAAREQDPMLDARAALLDQSYYQLLRLVNNLTAAALLSREEPLPLQDLDVVELVNGICEENASLAHLLGLDLRFSCWMPAHICAVNRGGLTQMIFQLLSNALRATPAGGTVTLELRQAGQLLLLTVTDTGSGIEEGKLATLFDRYLQQDSLCATPHGLGLGLPLCRRTAELMGGGIVVESRPGKGTRFTVSLPDRTTGKSGVSDVALDYSGGFNHSLLALADALPPKAFLLRSQE